MTKFYVEMVSAKIGRVARSPGTATDRVVGLLKFNEVIRDLEEKRKLTGGEAIRLERRSVGVAGLIWAGVIKPRG